MAFPMQFLSDNAAAVHPQVWDALHRADAADTPYDTDALSRRLDEAFSVLFGERGWHDGISNTHVVMVSR